MSSHSSNRRIPPLAGAFLALVVIGIAWWSITALSQAKPTDDAGQGAPSGPPPATVIMTPVENRISTQTQRIIGTLHARSRSDIAALEPGPILSIEINEGDIVKKNDLIATLDSRRLKALLAEAHAEVTVAEALVHQKKSRVKRSSIDLEMKEKLFAQRALSESEVLDARSANNVDQSVYRAAEDSLKAARSRLELLNVRLSDLSIRAPFDGRVVSRHVEPGEWVAEGAHIVTLTSSGEIEAWLKVPERFATAIQGQKIPVTVTATGQVITSSSLTIIPEAEESTRTLQVVLTLPNPEGALLPGLSVSAELPVTSSEKRLAVPINAVVQGYAGPGVFVATESEGSPLPIARRLPVEVLFQDAGFVYLKSDDLNAGDRVIVEGNERLFPSQPLLISERK
ncbi:MAG: efflux RND transporter periplasmic adaptor subunit [Verrucomicrobiaceae bacterium]